MSEGAQARMVDADGHLLEPADTWLRYIDPRFRDRAIRIEVDDQGLEVLLIDNKPMNGMRGTLGALGGIGMDKKDLFRPGVMTYADGSPPGSYDPRARLKVMDENGVDISLLYPTLGICWEGEVSDPELATAYTRGYNRWLAEFCSTDPKRLIPIAHLSLLDPKGVVEELERVAREGFKGVFISPDPAGRNGLPFSSREFAPFWEKLEETQIPVGLHVVVRSKPTFRDWLQNRADPNGLFLNSFLAIDVIGGFTQMIAQGIFDKYPTLRCTVLEAGASWISYWLDRMDHKWSALSLARLRMKPSDYFRRNCLVSADPDESMNAEVIAKLGSELFVWASDYPHVDATMAAFDEIRAAVAPLPAGDRANVLGENAIRFYRLDG